MASPTDNQVVSRVWNATKRILGAGRPSRKEPLTNDVLNDIKLWKAQICENIMHLRNVCLYVLAFVKLFRSEEVLNTARSE